LGGKFLKLPEDSPVVHIMNSSIPEVKEYITFSIQSRPTQNIPFSQSNDTKTFRVLDGLM